jgi:type VI secretion system protein ImpF
MARTELEKVLQPSVLDRLIDEEPTSASERPLTRSESLALLKRGVRRDLEWLLNTRRTIETAPEWLPEVAASLYHYGLEDITSLSRESIEVQARLAKLLEQAIEAYEPRLANVKVTVVPDERSYLGELRFVIDALLRLDPAPERITFDTVLETAKGLMQVSGTAHA